ncbi:MAG: hypothetical protein HY964_10285 [Ignavibacteriales bacterium]|nr:hypothetical protein [Ignavibacteriales bacterium]
MKNESIKVVVLPPESGKAYSATEKRKIQEVVLTSAIAKRKSGEPYIKAQVTVERDAGGNPKKLVVMLLRAHTYTADLVEVTVGPDYSVKAVRSQLADA